MSQRTLVFTIEALTVGGAEQMLVAMANRFVSRDWQVHMVCLTMAGELAEKLDARIQLHVLDKQPGVDRKLPGKLRRLMRQLNPDVVNSHLWTANTWTRVSLLGSGIPVVVTEHSRDFWKNKVYRLIDRLLSLSTDRMVAVSQDTADFYIKEIGVAEKRVTVINNGIETQRFASGQGEALRQSLLAPGEILIGTIGRMVSAKNHPRLVAAFEMLCKRHDNLQLVFVGDGETRPELEQAIAASAVADRIRLLGSRSDVADLLQAFDIFVLSSDREGHPLTALEAQAAGTPVVLTNAGGSADALADDGNQQGGYLVEKSAEALVAALHELIANADQREAMGRFGQQYATAHFDLDAMVSHYEQVFLDCLSGAR